MTVTLIAVPTVAAVAAVACAAGWWRERRLAVQTVRTVVEVSSARSPTPGLASGIRVARDCGLSIAAYSGRGDPARPAVDQPVRRSATAGRAPH